MPRATAGTRDAAGGTLIAAAGPLTRRLEDVDGTSDHERGQGEGAGRLEHDEQLGPWLDRRDVGGAERHGGPEAQRQVVDEPRHPACGHVLRVLHLREDEGGVAFGMVSPGGGATAV